MESSYRDTPSPGDRQARLTPEIQSIFAQAIDPILVLDDEGVCIAGNASAQEFFGLRDAELLTRAIDTLFVTDVDVLAQWRAQVKPHQHNVPPLASDRGHAITPQGANSGQWQIHLADPSSKTHRHEIEYQIIAHVGAHQHLFMWRDVTERNAADRQRQAITRALQQVGNLESPGQTSPQDEAIEQRDVLEKTVSGASSPPGQLLSQPRFSSTSASSGATGLSHAKPMEDLVRLNENRYRVVVNSQSELICRFLPDATLTFVNSAYCRYCGKTENELIGESFLSLIPRDNRAEVQQQINELQFLTPNCPMVVHEHPVTLVSGETCWQEWSNTAIFDAQGQIIEFQSIGRDITQRKQDELMLKTSEHRLRTVLETMALIGIMLDRQGNLIFCNDYLLTLTGWERDEVLNQSWFERFLPPDIRYDIRCSVFEHTLETGEFPVHYENEIVTRSGDRRLIAWNNTVFRDPKGNVLNVTSIGHDITEQRQTEQMLQQERQLFIGGPTVVFKWQVADGWPVSYVSPNVQDLLGYAPEDFTSGGLLFASLIHPDDLEYVAHEVRTYTREGRTTFEQTYRLRRADGDYRWFSDFTVVIRNTQGDVTFYAGYVQDISDRKRAEQARQEAQDALIESEERLRLALEGANMGLWDWNLTTNTVVWSSGLERIMGLQPGQFDGTIETVKAMTHPDDWDRVAGAIALALDHDEPYEIEFRFIKPDGTVRWALGKASVYRNHAGVPIRMAGIDVDITDRKESELALRQSEARLSHVLNNAIASIVSCRIYADGHWDYDYVSSGCQLILGYSAEDIINNPMLWQSRILPEDWENGYRRCLDQIFAEQDLLSEYRFRHKDGSIRWVSSRISSTRDDAADCWRVTFIDMDITPQKQAEFELHASRQQYRNLINSIDGVVWELDYETFTFTFVSPQAEHLLGYPCEEWLADSAFWANHIHPDDRERIVKLCTTESQRLRNHTLDYRMIAADGRTVWVREIVNVTAEGGQPVTLQGLLIDVTAEKQQQELLRHYERIVSATPDAIALIDQHYHYLVANQAYLTWHALTEQELIGTHVAETFGQETFQSLLKPRLDDALTGNIVRFQDWFDGREGGLQFISITYAPYFEENGSVIGVVVVARDITGLKQAEVTLHRQAEQEHLLACITNRIRQTLNLQSILDTTVAEVQGYLGADRVLVYEFDENQMGVVIAEAVAEGYPSLWGRIITDQCFTTERCMAAYVHGRIQNVADIHAAHLPACYVEMLSQFGVRANLVMPILQNHHVWGLLVAQHCAEPRIWRQDEIDLLEQLTHQMAIAIQQAELYKQVHALNVNLEAQVRDRTADLEQSLAFESLLKRITIHVRDSLEEHHIFERVVRELAEGLDAYSCDTSMYDLEKQISYIQHEYIRSTIPKAHGSTVQMDDFEQIYAQLLEGKSLQFCWLPVQNDVRLIDGEVMCLTCPMIDDQGVLGDIWIYRPSDRPFNEAEIHLVEQVANQCAIALRQARLYESAQAQVTELERLNRLKDDFLSTVSHELRTPMSNIKMALQMFEIYLGRTQLLDDAELPLGQYFQILKDECDRETDLINNLLDLTRLDSDAEPLFEQSMSLSLWVQHIAEVFVERAHRQQQTLTIDIPESVMIHTDLSYLERVVVELLNNACKYTPEGGHIRVFMRSWSEKTAPDYSTQPSRAKPMQLVVSNSGIELPPAECDRIFERFYRIPNNDPWKHGGTGLGLALVQKLVRKLGARIHAESDNNEVRFILTFSSNRMPKSSVSAIGSDSNAEQDA